MDQARCSGYRPMRTCVGTGSKSRPCPCHYRNGKAAHRFAEETEAHIGEALRLSPRNSLAYVWKTNAGIAKDLLGLSDQAVAVSDGDRVQSKLSSFTLRVGGLARAAWSTGRGSFRRQGRSCARSRLLHLRPRRLDRGERRPDVSGPGRAHSRRHAQGRGPGTMTAARRLAAILAADVVGYSRLMGEDEAGTARAVKEHREAAHPLIAGHGGRIVKRTGDGLCWSFRSVVDAVECAIEMQSAWPSATPGRPSAHRLPHRRQPRRRASRGRRRHYGRRRQYRRAAGGHLRAGRDLPLEAAYARSRRLDPRLVDLGDKDLKNIAEPMRVYVESASRFCAKRAPAPASEEPRRRACRSSSCRSPISAATRSRSISSTGSPRA